MYDNSLCSFNQLISYCSHLRDPVALASHGLESPGTLSLSLDWNNKVHYTGAQVQIATSQSDKSLSLFELDASGLRYVNLFPILGVILKHYTHVLE